MADYEATLEGFESIVGDRKVAFITMLDTLEHLVDGDAVLQAIQTFAHRYSAIFVMSVPNVAHRDVGFKLALGQWDYTRAGLLDHTHVRLFSNAGLKQVTNSAGLYEIDAEDVQLVISDQHFPATHPALAEGSLLNIYLRRLRDGIDSFATVNQFVRAYVAGPRDRTEYHSVAQKGSDVFLTIVTRTQGRRLHTLREIFVSLAGQSDQDFEMLVIGHKLDSGRQLKIERMIEDNPEWLRDRIRFLRVDEGNRTKPLNVGFEVARGEYVVILDDDDLPFAHWVEIFHGLAAKEPGRLLRSVAVRQKVEDVHVNGLLGLQATGGLERCYPSEFDLFRHFHMNETPPVSVAFPRGVFHSLNIRFDESLTTTEDWDYILRSALHVGVVSSPEITSIYRWWETGESSRAVHSQQEWKLNHELIWHKLNMAPMMLPPGAFGQIRSLVEQNESLQAENRNSKQIVKLHQAGREKNLAVASSIEHAESRQRLEHLEELINLVTSTSWSVSAPLRWLAYLFGRPRTRVGQFVWSSKSDIEGMIAAVKRSSSWRYTKFLRRSR